MLLLLLLGGCGEELGSTKMPTAPVRGQVRIGSTPLTRGFVEFRPVDGTVGRLRWARIGPDGRFATDGVAVGTVGLRFVGAGLPTQLVRNFGQSYLIRREVAQLSPTVMTIDLQAEQFLINAQR